MRDFEAYYAAGQAARAHLDSYGTAIWSFERPLSGAATHRYEVLPFVGPPAYLPLWSALARLSFNVANVVWRTILIFCAAALIVLALRIGGAALHARALIAAAVFGFGFGPLTSAVALGQTALPAFACAALALYWPFAAIGAWLQPNLAIALISQIRDKRKVLIYAITALLFIAGCLLAVGTRGCVNYVSMLREHELAERFSAIQLTPAAIAHGFGAPDSAALAVGIAIALFAVAIWAVLMRATSGAEARFALTCALLPLTAPFFHEHDLLIAIVPALYVTTRCSRGLWPLAAAAALMCATDWLGLAQRPDGVTQTLLLVGAAGAALFSLRSDLSLRALVGPACVMALIAAAGAVAQHHVLPVWPDAMQRLPSTIAAADTAQVWHAEQLATGLLRPNFFWALLRCASLAGCVVLALAVPARSPAGNSSDVDVHELVELRHRSGVVVP